jgi:internalin A
MSELAHKLIEENKKTKATILDLGNCGLTALPEELKDLSWLEELRLGYDYFDFENKNWVTTRNKGKSNKIPVLPQWIGELVNLQSLALNDISLETVEALGLLRALRVINVSNSEVSDLNPLKNLANLQLLYCSSTQVSDLNPLKNHANLQQLDCSSTQVSDLNPLKNLANLQLLDCSSTQVSDLNPLKNLANLLHLDCRSTQVSDLNPLKNRIENGLPVHWKEGDGIGIFIKDSPLDKSLIAAIKAGNEAVIKYLNKPKERLWEARVLVLGEPRAGKTTLRRKLKSPTAAMPTDVESTKGIEIEIETYKCRLQKDNVSYKMQYYLWDFGGQDMYRLLHQLFVSEQAIYIIVTDTDRNKNEEEIDFWLETIQRLGRDKNGKYGPVILLQNPKTNREGGSFPDLKKRYSELWRQSDDFVINLNKIAKGTEGFDRMELERFNYFIKYLENSFHQLDHLGQEMPRAWVRIRRALVKQTVNNWITLEAFRSVCEKENIRNSSEQEDLLKIFHILGFVLHYDTGSLRGMVILNKEWATDALYRVLDDEIVKSNEGWFFKSDAKKIWHDTKYQDRENELLLLMQEFKLCYFNETSQKYIVPSKLPEDTEGLPEWDTNNNVRLFLRYDWLPRPVATQLIVLLHDHIVQINDQKQWIWRKGAVLDGKKLDLMDAQVRILDNWRERQIEIYARGKSSEYLIRTLMQHWRIVHEPYEDKVEVQKIILCNCDTCQSLNKPFEFDYQEVLDAREAREPLRCNKSRKDLSATDILRGVFDETTVLVDSISAKGGRSELLDLIAAGELGQALDRLPNSETLLALKARYNNLHDQQLRGVIHAEAYRVEWNQLVDILIVYLNTNNFQRGKYVPIFKDGNLSEDYMVPTRGFDGKPSIQYNFSIHGGQVNIADEIGKVRFSPELGVSKADFESLKKQFQNLSAAQQDSLKTLVVEEPEATTEIEKTSIGNKIVALLNDNAIPILQNLTASAYYDLIKLFLDV